ncbi:MAG: hypothetical protein U5J96_08680, partial [Ignavibacteriaceae bacterium]|nr:hypothetical protein [Ignavibacteriaceae bacterium]
FWRTELRNVFIPQIKKNLYIWLQFSQEINLNAEYLYQSTKDSWCKEITLRGWLFNKRSAEKSGLLILRDGTGYVQCVYFKGNVSDEIFDLADKIGQGIIDNCYG